MKVSPFYSSNKKDPHVFHNDSTCPTGKQIPVINIRYGTNSQPLCTQCAGK